MPLTIVDGRPKAHQGDLALNVLEAIIKNSLYNTTYGAWSTAGATVTIVRGAHQGTTYHAYNTNYYFDVTVTGDAGTWHSLLNHPADENSHVMANV